MRFIALTRPAEVVRRPRRGAPAGRGGVRAHLLPAHGLRPRGGAARWPTPSRWTVLRDTVVHGTPDDVAATDLGVRRGRGPPRAAHQHDPARRTGAGGVQRGAPGRRRRGAPRRVPGGEVRGRGAVAAALGLAVGLGAAGPAGAAPRTITLDGWADQAAVLSGTTLVVAEAATVHVDPRVIAGSPPGAAPFDYYRAETSRARARTAPAPASRGRSRPPSRCARASPPWDRGSSPPAGPGPS